ncbi:hypothetical protein [Roseovarius sp. ZX-A-9]|uniref:hypothetical protein n=1 Tax=Roseovarius sp. ZX-A-9 TaxID=3014783 RepID=UPI00232FC394|nr:hypothetical protein [Roseovarius sp. ZX-A-9]
MSDAPYLFDYIRALVPILIAIFVAYVAYQQWQTNHESLREKLFDRRIEVHDQVAAALSRLLREGFPAAGIENELAQAWRKSRFLFDDEVSEYIEKLREAVNDGQFYHSQAALNNEKRNDYLDKEHDRLNWLAKQFDPLHEHFAKYLRLRFGRK